MFAFRDLLFYAMEHGAGFDWEKVIEVTAARTARAIVYHFRDPGNGFDKTDLSRAHLAHSSKDMFSEIQRRTTLALSASAASFATGQQQTSRNLS